MAHVFISYSKKNRDYARKLANYLLANGFDVWIDDRIDFGSNWEREIFEAVDACAAIIVIMTPESYKSLWVQRERQYAENRGKQPFPLLLDGEAFPFYVVIQHYDVRGEKLPEPAFLEQLAAFAPRHASTGQDVAATPQQQAKLRFETSEMAKAEPEAATPEQQAPGPRPRSRGWIVYTAALLMVALAVALVAAANGGTLGGVAAPTPTPTLFGGGPGEFAFVSDRDGNPEIYLANVDGSNPRNLTNDPAEDTEPAWSPDGTQIVFTSYRADGNARTYIMDADGSNVRHLIDEQSGWDPAWSPDGTQIAFTDYGDNSAEIFLVGTDGHNLQQLTDNSFGDGYPAWSPDGTQIVFVSEPDGNEDIYIMDADGGNLIGLTEDPAGETAPSWSPEGTQIAFQSNQDEYSQICVIDVDGANLDCAPSDSGDAYNPAWSPDGTQIMFTSYRDSNFGREIYTMNPDGTDVRRVTDDPAEDMFPDWRP